jgi:DNA modification methylase
VNWEILEGDCREVLVSLPDRSVQTVVTSPPYFGLRDYGTGEWEGGDEGCQHYQGRNGSGRADGIVDERGQRNRDGAAALTSGRCSGCGARRVDRQIGLEPSPDEYVAGLVSVFREVRRVLRDDGTVWLNLGDSYSGYHGNSRVGDGPAPSDKGEHYRENMRATVIGGGIKQKDLLGIPWMVAFALRADGWVLRSEIVWNKPNPMPESVTDRCTKSHEQIFMFSKGSWSGPEPGEFAHISEEDARWLALFFDAEGSLVLRRERDGARHAAQISLGSTCRPLLEAAQRIVGAGNILERPGQNAPMHYWQLANKRARDLLVRLYPHLIVKQRQARCLIDLESRKWYRGDNRKGLGPSELAYRERLWETVKALNSFGEPDVSWVPVPKIGRWTAGPRYFYDADAIREGASENTHARRADGARSLGQIRRADPATSPPQFNGNYGFAGRQDTGDRNRRSVWTVATQPFPGAHFATFPPKLIEPCILAGSSPKACGVCGAPWRRVTERGEVLSTGGSATGARASNMATVSPLGQDPHSGAFNTGAFVQREHVTVGWGSSCQHQDDTGRSVVLDPFAGAGTTGVVSRMHDRRFIGVELNPAYAEMARERIRLAEPQGWQEALL